MFHPLIYKLQEALRRQQQPFRFLKKKKELNLNCPFCGDKRMRLFFNYEKFKGWCWNEAQSVSVKKIFDYFHVQIGSEIYSYDTSLSTLKQRFKDFRQKDRRQYVCDHPEISSTTGYQKIKKTDQAYTYLQQRGISQNKIEEYQLRWCSSGNYYGRIIIPIFDLVGRCVSFSARDFLGTQTPKYLFKQGTFVGSTLFRANWLQQDAFCVLVEGQMPAMVFGHGFYGTFGKKVSAGQQNQLLEAGIKTVVILFDADAHAEGEATAKRLADWFTVKFVKLPSGQPDDYSKKELFVYIQKTPYYNDWKTQFKEGIV